MNTKVELYGAVEKLLKKHNDSSFPHIKSFSGYLVEMARQRAEKDSRDGLIVKLKKLQTMDEEESAHIQADKLLLEYINDEEISKAFSEIDKYYA